RQCGKGALRKLLLPPCTCGGVGAGGGEFSIRLDGRTLRPSQTALRSPELLLGDRGRLLGFDEFPLLAAEGNRELFELEEESVSVRFCGRSRKRLAGLGGGGPGLRPRLGGCP